MAGCNTPARIVCPVPNKPATPNRSVRIADDLWALVVRAADDEGVTATEIVIRALKQYLRR